MQDLSILLCVNFPTVSKQVQPVEHVTGQFSLAPFLLQRTSVFFDTKRQFFDNFLRPYSKCVLLSWQKFPCSIGEEEGTEDVAGDGTEDGAGEGTCIDK